MTLDFFLIFRKGISSERIKSFVTTKFSSIKISKSFDRLPPLKYSTQIEVSAITYINGLLAHQDQYLNQFSP